MKLAYALLILGGLWFVDGTARYIFTQYVSMTIVLGAICLVAGYILYRRNKNVKKA